MNVAEVLRSAAEAGLVLSLNPDGRIRAEGSPASVAALSSAIKLNRDEIAAALRGQAHRDDASTARAVESDSTMAARDDIEASDITGKVVTVTTAPGPLPSSVAKRIDALEANGALPSDDAALIRAKYSDDTTGWLAVLRLFPVPVERDATPEPSCRSCLHRFRPGLSDGYCGADRQDLPRAYGDGHQLRRLPADGGITCDRYEVQP